MSTSLQEKINDIFSQRLIERMGKDINVVIFASEYDKSERDDKLSPTVIRIQEECKKLKIPFFTAMSGSVQLKKTKEGYTVSNVGESKNIKITPSNTVVFARNNSKSLSNLDIISQLEKNGFYCINERECVEICCDKYRTILKLAEGGLSCPKTYILRNENDIPFAIKELKNKFPLIVKTLDGSQGVGVFIVESEKALNSTLQTIWELNPELELIIQHKIDASYDVRVHVLEGEVIACMKRDIVKGDFRSNYSQGAKLHNIELDDDIKKLCIKASEIVGGKWTGVDYVVGPDKVPYFIEVNSCPGTEGIEEVTKKNIVAEILDKIIQKL
jgi:RimK family alpha-L-glutamate ligase